MDWDEAKTVLRNLKDFHEEGLIDEQEYKVEKSYILNKLLGDAAPNAVVHVIAPPPQPRMIWTTRNVQTFPIDE